MDKNSTLNDFIRYAYNETEMADSVRIQSSIDSDPLVEQDYQELIRSMGMMDSLVMEPADQLIHNILGYSRKTMNKAAAIS